MRNLRANIPSLEDLHGAYPFLTRIPPILRRPIGADDPVYSSSNSNGIVIDLATRKLTATWHLAGVERPDMRNFKCEC
jgi:hypothetical protein